MTRDINWYIDRAKENSGATSDRKLSELIGLSNVGVSSWRTGKAIPTDETMSRIAKIAGVDPYIALLDLNMWRSSGDAQKTYSEILKKIMGVIAMVVFLGLAAPSQAQASAGGTMSNIINSGSIHYHIIIMVFRTQSPHQIPIYSRLFYLSSLLLLP